MLQNSRLNPPQKLLGIRNLAEEGCSAVEIANLMDSTPGSVRVFCSRHKIKIRRSQRYLRSALPRHIHSPSEHTIVARMPAQLYFDFHRKAERLQMPVSVLASNLLAAIASSNIYEAVLDDKDSRRRADIAAQHIDQPVARHVHHTKQISATHRTHGNALRDVQLGQTNSMPTSRRTV
jgi:hypothetical protein